MANKDCTPSANIVLHNWEEKNISQLKTETKIGKLLVPSGYVNATQMCKACNKKWNDYA